MNPLPRLPRMVLLLPLAAILATPAVLAAPHPPRHPAAAVASPADLLTSLWSFLASAWSKNGCNLDPDGRCLPAPASSSTTAGDNGCNVDPSGRCLPAAQLSTTANGCNVDPDGRCNK